MKCLSLCPGLANFFSRIPSGRSSRGRLTSLGDHAWMVSMSLLSSFIEKMECSAHLKLRTYLKSYRNEVRKFNAVCS